MRNRAFNMYCASICNGYTQELDIFEAQFGIK